MKPHKHAELIKAWADGAKIQFYDQRFNEHRWKDCGADPYWSDDVQFRIKTYPKPDLRLFYFVTKENGAQLSTAIYSHNLILSFDGETGKLKSAEVL